jgi:hypothetical protein
MQAAGQESPPAAQSSDSSSTQPKGDTGGAQNPPASAPQTPPSSAPATPSAAPSPAPAPTPAEKKANLGKHRRTNKKRAKADQAPDCEKTATTTTGAAAPGSAAGAEAAGTAKTPPTTCPPPKIVVHDGGTTEPAIQLVGGAGGEKAAGQRSTTDQLVGSTEENLKKISGRQLDSNQLEMLKQIQQFLDQSKAAVAAGDMERGHNLAMKARLLSDELAKP